MIPAPIWSSTLYSASNRAWPCCAIRREEVQSLPLTIPILEVRVEQLAWNPSLTVVCPGYENSIWRAGPLVRHTFDRHLASFALPYSDLRGLDHNTAAALLRRAAKAVYATDRYRRRGEFGELFLHAICRDIFGSEPAISKITFKDSANDTVKGFDSVHVVEAAGELELWLGEVKFYANLTQAIRDSTAELADHLKAEYLRGEFVAVVNKLDPEWPHSQAVARLLEPNTSLDEIFDVLTVPVLLTYDSDSVLANTRLCSAYIDGLRAEANSAWSSFDKRCDPRWPVRLRLILLPLLNKDELVELMQESLVAWQQV